MDIINDMEFTSLFQKSKKLVDNARSNVAGMRQFNMTYKDRENEIIQSQIGQLDIAYSKLPFKLSWTHYQMLMCIEDKDDVLRLANVGAIPQNRRTYYIRHMFLNLPDWGTRHLTMKVIWNRHSALQKE